MSHPAWYTRRMIKTDMKTFRIETEDRYGQFNEDDIQAESLSVATAIAEAQPHVIVTDVKEIPEVQLWAYY